MAAKGPDPLEQRVREGASDFEFGALINDSEAKSAMRRATMEERFESYLSETNGNDEVQPGLIAVKTREKAAHGRANTVAVVTAALGVLALGGWSLYLRQTSIASAGQQTAAAVVRQNPGAAQAQADQKPAAPKVGLPRPELTPGERSPQASAGVPIPDSVRKQVFTAYGFGPDDQVHIAVRLIPSALGGTNGAKNVFPVTPWFAGLKARLDDFLVGEIRAGRMTPVQAESELTSNWIRACHHHYVRNYGENDSEKARQTEDKLHWQ